MPPILMGTMVTTTQARRLKNNPRDLFQRWPELTAVLIVWTVLLVSLPSFIIDVSLSNAHLLKWESKRGQSVDPIELRRASIAYEEAAGAFGSEALNWERSAAMAIQAAQLNGQSGELDLARRFLVRTAMSAPSRGAVWTYIVYLDHLNGIFDEKTISAWRLASLTSRLELDEMRVRLWVGLLMWPQLPADVKADLVALGHTMWSPRVNWPARKEMAKVYSVLPQTAQARVAFLLPDPSNDLATLQRLAENVKSN